MSMKRTIPLAVLLVPLVGLGHVTAQQQQVPLQTSNSQQDEQRADRSQQARQKVGQEQSAESRVPGKQAKASTVKQVVINEFMNANKAEIELAQLAQEKTDNEELKQFAQTLIDDHQQLKQKLEKVAGKDRDQRGVEPGRRSGRGQSQGDRSPFGGARDEGQTQDSNRRNQGEQRQDRSEQTEGRQTPAFGGTQDDNARRQRGGAFARNASEQSSEVPEELCKILDQTAKNSLEMTKKMLKEHDGQDFQMGFLGQQIIAHTQMIAKLNAVQSEGPSGLEDFTEQALGKSKQHLKQAKELAKKLEDQEEVSRQARR
jgi:predicted outer membrane protein